MRKRRKYVVIYDDDMQSVSSEEFSLIRPIVLREGAVIYELVKAKPKKQKPKAKKNKR